MPDDGYEACGTERVDMRKRIIARMVSSPGYLAAIPLTVADLRAEGDDEGADELSRLAAEARRRIQERAWCGTPRRGRQPSATADQGLAVAVSRSRPSKPLASSDRCDAQVL